MPSHKTHRLISRLILGKEYPEVDRWLDQPYRHLGPRHRILRHTPAEVIAKFGVSDKALAGLLHIALDYAVSEAKRKLRQKKSKRKRRKKKS